MRETDLEQIDSTDQYRESRITYLGTRSKRGTTLVEILFAVFMLLACAAVLSATTPIASMSRYKAEMSNKAAGIAQKQLEAIKAAGYANAATTQLVTYGLIDNNTDLGGGTFSFTNSDSANLDNPAKVLPSGTGTVKIEQLATDLRRVTVTVSWNERGTTRSFTVGTLIANI